MQCCAMKKFNASSVARVYSIFAAKAGEKTAQSDGRLHCVLQGYFAKLLLFSPTASCVSSQN